MAFIDLFSRFLPVNLKKKQDFWTKIFDLMTQRISKSFFITVSESGLI